MTIETIRDAFVVRGDQLWSVVRLVSILYLRPAAPFMFHVALRIVG